MALYYSAGNDSKLLRGNWRDLQSRLLDGNYFDCFGCWVDPLAGGQKPQVMVPVQVCVK